MPDKLLMFILPGFLYVFLSKNDRESLIGSLFQLRRRGGIEVIRQLYKFSKVFGYCFHLKSTLFKTLTGVFGNDKGIEAG